MRQGRLSAHFQGTHLSLWQAQRYSQNHTKRSRCRHNECSWPDGHSPCPSIAKQPLWRYNKWWAEIPKQSLHFTLKKNSLNSQWKWVNWENLEDCNKYACVTTAPNIAVIILHLQAIFLHTRTPTCYISITTHKEQPPPYPGPNMFQHIFTGFNPKLPENPVQVHSSWYSWALTSLGCDSSRCARCHSSVFPKLKTAGRPVPFPKTLLLTFKKRVSCNCLLSIRVNTICSALVTAIWLFMSVGLSCSFQDLRILDLHAIICIRPFYSHRTTTLTLAPTGRFNTYSKIPKVDKYIIILYI